MTTEATFTADKQAVMELIAKKLDQANALIEECVFLAEEVGTTFNLPWGGEGTSQRGMGATYIATTADQRTIDVFSNDGYAGWNPSAGTC